MKSKFELGFMEMPELTPELLAQIAADGARRKKRAEDIRNGVPAGRETVGVIIGGKLVQFEE